MTRLKRLIVEIHRRSLWQVLAIYLGACWAVLEASDQVIERYLLPEWVYPTEIIILLVTLPIVLATAFVREGAPSDAAVSVSGELRDPTLLGDTEAPGESEESRPARRFFTWRRTTVWVLFAFGALALISASVVIRGAGRVTDARGEAGEAFEERAWLVVAEFGADEGEAEIAEAARAALIVDLQQSQYINVYTASQITPVLRRMTVSPTTPIDEGLALEKFEAAAEILAARPYGASPVFAAGADLRRELARFALVEQRAFDRYYVVTRQVRRREVDEQRLADALQRDVLPAWRAACERFTTAVAGLPEGEDPVVIELKRYMQLQEESWVLLGQAIREGDQEKRRRAVQKARAAAEISRRIRAADGP